MNKNLSQHFYNTLPDAEVIEVELVWRFRNCEGEELFSVLVDVRRQPAPIAVLAIVKIVESTLPENEQKINLTHFYFQSTIIFMNTYHSFDCIFF